MWDFSTSKQNCSSVVVSWQCLIMAVYVNIIVEKYLFIDWFISKIVQVIPKGLKGVLPSYGIGHMLTYVIA